MQQPHRPPRMSQTDSGFVPVVPVSAIKQRDGKPSPGDVINMTPWQWDAVKDSGLHKRVSLHAVVQRQAYPAPMGDVVDPGAVDIYLPEP